MFTLVIFELVPEDTHLYVIPNSEITDEIRGVLEGAHGKLINADDGVEMALRLSNMIGESSPEDKDSTLSQEEHNIFAQHRVNKDFPVRDTHVTHIYLSGWFL